MKRNKAKKIIENYYCYYGKYIQVIGIKQQQ